jgi:hypothetical protein
MQAARAPFCWERIACGVGEVGIFSASNPRLSALPWSRIGNGGIEYGSCGGVQRSVASSPEIPTSV